MDRTFARRKGESLMIGDGIKVTVTLLHGDSVILTTNTPPATSVHRKEIWEIIQSEKAAKAKENKPCA